MDSMTDSIMDNLLLEIASYFQRGADGKYYLREGFMFLPQDLIIRLKKYEESVRCQ